MNRFLSVAALTLIFAAGCGDGSTEPVDPRAAAAGTYTLASYNSASLPALYFQNSAGRIDVISGSMVLRADGSFTETINLRTTYTSGAAPGNTPIVENGTFAVTGTQITFTLPPSGSAGGFSWTGAISGNVVSYTYEGDAWRYQKS